MINTVHQILDRSTSISLAANKLDVDVSTVRKWVHGYNMNGLDYFTERPRNNTYTKEFKQSVIDEYLEGTDSLLNLSIKYGIRSKSTLLSWVNKYNRHETMEDYDPKGDVYMSKCRKVRYEEKLEIAEHCIQNNYDYKGTASIYRLAYSQVYNWVKKYDEFGKEGLIDKRGKRTPIEDLSEIDKLKRENKFLKQQLEHKEMESILLKKLEEIERRGYSRASNKKRNT